MSQYQIAVIVGSLRKDSLNRKLAAAMVKLGPPEFAFRQVEIGNLPLYNQDEDANPTDVVTKFRAEIAAAQGIMFVTPEYNRSIPGVLKNAIDIGSRPYGHNAWSKKSAGLLGISPGAFGTSMAQQHLRNILAAVNVHTLCHPEAFLQFKEEFFDANGDIGEGSRKFLQGWMDRYVAWVKKIALQM